MMQEIQAAPEQVAHGQRLSITRQDILLLLLVLVFATLPLAPAPAGVAVALLMSYWLFSGICWSERRLWLSQDWFVPAMFLFVLPWVGLLWSPDVATGLKDAERSIYWIYGLAAATVSYRRYAPRMLVFGFLAGLLVNVLVSVLQYLQLLPMYKGPGYGFLNHITYSLLLVAGMLFLAYLYREQKKWLVRLIILGGMFLLGWNLAIGVSRAGYLAFILAMPWMLSVMFSRRQIVWIVLSCLLATGALASSSVVRSRMAEIRQDVQEYKHGHGATSVGLRFHMWVGALKIWKAHPVFGVGTGGYRQALKKVVSPEYAIFTHPHNSVLYMAASYGAVGVLVFGWFVYVVLRRGWRTRATVTGRIILVLFFVIGVGSITDTQIMGHATGALLGFIGGLATGSLETDDESGDN
ncbi:MAG: O-antigen ligase family protein [Trichlorobacter sp.]|jgi:O-antigen ligase